MPSYDDDVCNTRKTAERFECEHKRREKEAATYEDEKSRGSLLFGNWMISRRICEYYFFAECQDKGIHEVAIVGHGVDVYTSGLFEEAGEPAG